MNTDERMERMEQLCLICWDGYLQVLARQNAMMELVSGLLTGAATPGTRSAAEIQDWLKQRMPDLTNDLLIDVEKEDKALAARLSARAEARRQRDQNR